MILFLRIDHYLRRNRKKVVKALCVEVRREEHKRCSVKQMTTSSLLLAGAELLLPQVYYVLNYFFAGLILGMEFLL